MRALGSPADLVSNVGGGAKSLVYKPALGLVQGPAEFFEGVNSGAQSFVKGEKWIYGLSHMFMCFSKRKIATLSAHLRRHAVTRGSCTAVHELSPAHYCTLQVSSSFFNHLMCQRSLSCKRSRLTW